MSVQKRLQKRGAPVAASHVSSLEDAFLSLSDRGEVERFLTDLCTPAEIDALRQRWAVAQLLDTHIPQREAAQRAKASIATVTRVARFLQHERHQGYRVVLDRLNRKGRA